MNEDYAEMSELNLIVACQRRKSGAIEQLLERHKRTMSNILYRLHPNLVDASDLCQDASIRVWRSIPRLKNPLCFRAWLRRIVTNVYYDRLRSLPREIWIVSMDERMIDNECIHSVTRSIRDPALMPDEIALQKELSDVLKEAISAIPLQFSEPLLLREENGLSYEEIATVTNLNIGTVKSRISRARSKVKQRIHPYVDDSMRKA